MTRLLFAFLEVVVACCFALAACRKSNPVDERLHRWNPVTSPGRSVALPNFGMKLKQVSSGAHINCGADSLGRAVSWGVGDFVEVPHYQVDRIVCADSGHGVVAAEPFTAFGYSDRVRSLVGSIHARREAPTLR